MRLRTVVVRGAVAAAAAAAPPVVWWLCRPTLTVLRDSLARGTMPGASGLDVLLSMLAVAALGPAVLWACAVVAGAVVEAATGWSCGLVRRITPALVRRALSTALGLALGTGTALTPTAATAPPEPPPSTVGAASADRPDLEGLRLPDRPTGDLVVRAARPALSSTHRVRAGECLWSIAAGRLPASADVVRIDEAWRAIYHANREVVGPDPDLVHPGTVLRLPGVLSSSPSTLDRRDRR